MPRRAGNVNTRRGGACVRLCPRTGRAVGGCAAGAAWLRVGAVPAGGYFAAAAFWASWKAWAFSERCTSFVRNSCRTAS